MTCTRIQATLRRRPLGRQALACVLVLALLWAQSLGLWHSVAHGGAFHAGQTAVTQTVAPEPAHTPSLLERLFAGHHAATDCQFFDQHSHGDVLSTATAAAALLALPMPTLLASHALAVARWHALFQARGPPSVR